jgi:hypothetical protein
MPRAEPAPRAMPIFLRAGDWFMDRAFIELPLSYRILNNNRFTTPELQQLIIVRQSG